MKLLFLSPIIPYPVVDGDRQRAFHTLRFLAQRHEVHFIGFCRQPSDVQGLKELRTFCTQAEGVEISRWTLGRNAIRGWWSPRPLNVEAYYSRRMEARVQTLVAQARIQILHAYRLRMAPYALSIPGPLRVLDYTDALTRHFQIRCETPMPWWRRIYLQQEYLRLARYEVEVSHRFDRCLISSDLDRQALVSRGAHPDLREVTNGVDTRAFRPMEKLTAKPEILFVGNLEYGPNLWGLEDFCIHCWPRIKRRLPQAHLTVIGQQPRSFHRLAWTHTPGIEFVGVVSALQPYFKKTRVAICPLRIASGRQFKVLEYLAAGLPTVVSPIVAENLGAKVGRHLLAESDPVALADAVVRLCQQDPLAGRLRKSGRAFVVKTFDWAVAEKQLLAVYRDLSVLARTKASSK